MRLLTCLVTVLAVVRAKAETFNLHSCQVEAVFAMPDGTFFAVERSVGHPGLGAGGSEVVTSHVSRWKKWNNRFPVIDQEHDQLPRSEHVFPQSPDYVHAASSNEQNELVLAVEYSPAQSLAEKVDKFAVLVYDYRDGNFSFKERHSATDYYPHIKRIAEDEKSPFMRIVNIAYISGPLPEDKQYIVTSWYMGNRTVIVETRLRMDKSEIQTKKILRYDSDQLYIPNTLHVMSSTADADEVLQGTYGIWRYSQYPKNVDRALLPERTGMWHLQNPLLGCPQELCFDSDVDAITTAPDATLIFRGCYFWRTSRLSEPGEENGSGAPHVDNAQLIRTVWPNIGCNVAAVMFVPPDTLYLFREGFFYRCSFSDNTCGDPVPIRNLFKGVESVSAATMTPDGRIWLITSDRIIKYSVFKLSGDSAEQLEGMRYLQPDYPFLPEAIDDIDATSNGYIRFFTQSHYFDIKDGSRAEVVPQHIPGFLISCANDLYAVAKLLAVNNLNQYHNWRQAPRPAPALTAEQLDQERNKEFNWLWLLLLLLLLIPICCFIPCRRSRPRSDPRARPESVFARSALGSALSGIMPDNDLRSAITSVPSDYAATRPPGSSAASRSAMSDPSSGRPTGLQTPSSKRSGMSSPSGAPLSSGSKRSGMSGPSGPGVPGTGQMPSSGAGSRSGMSNPSGPPASSGSREVV